jgi:hypothetical protein
VKAEEMMAAVPASVHARCGHVDRHLSESSWDRADIHDGGDDWTD